MNDTSGQLKLPGGWTWAKLNQITEVIRGASPRPKGDPRFFGGDIPWIMISDVTKEKGKFISKTRDTVTKDGAERSRYLPSGTLILSNSGTVCVPKILAVDGCIHDGFVAFPNLTDQLEMLYLFYYFDQIRPKMIQENRQGVTQVNLNTDIVKNIDVPLPPLYEQQRIVAKIEELFTKLDAGVDALKKALAHLKRYRQTLLKAAVTGDLTREWRESQRGELEPAAHLLARILQERRARWEADQLGKMQAADTPPKDDDWKQRYQEPAAPDTSELPELPEGWIWTRAEQLCGFITKGTTPAANKLFSEYGEIPFIKVYNLTHVGLLDFTVKPTFVSQETHRGELARSKVSPGDVLMNIVGPPLGKVSIVPDTHEEWNINQAVAVYRPMPSFDRKYLSICLLTGEIQSWAERRAKATAGQFNLTLEICRDLPLPLPTLLEQQQIVLEVERLLSVADATEETIARSLKQAERMRQSILQQAFAGKLVPQDPADEPASSLIERIREERAREAEVNPKQKRKSEKPKSTSQKHKSNKRKQAAQTSFIT